MVEILLSLRRARRYATCVSQSTFSCVGSPDACIYVHMCVYVGVSNFLWGDFMCLSVTLIFLLFSTLYLFLL